APNHFWLEHNFITREIVVLDNGLEVNVPKDSKVKLRTAPGFEATTRDQDDRRIYSWKRANFKKEDADEKDDEAEEGEESDEPRHPHVQITTFQNWDEVGK